MHKVTWEPFGALQICELKTEPNTPAMLFKPMHIHKYWLLKKATRHAIK